ncbi:MAG: triose-phosphate isomerase [Spirochaetales bacterium]|uniref:Triosephosphate isomerase n=1 Tax=Candidatus Thalassospirochaeta sargassi TaxID=3119039 RepID=A0AAJ1IH78_9SPIO|nr:triose-phosphate isomerase [Spirochaetales bacterium]
MRRSFIAGNWKMHKTPAEAVALAEELKAGLAGCSHKILIAPSFTALTSVAEVVKGSNILLGAQNMAAVEQGAHTGETSVLMLKAIGVDAVILGHSERRHVYGETDEMINEKVKLALANELEVILCVGETLDEREAGKAEAVVKTQTEAGLAGVSESELSKVTIAYEPVWAIGTGKTATPDDADQIHRVTRDTVKSLYSADAAEKMVIQYGGSVKPDNAAELMGMENIDGALVGGASLKADLFLPIAEYDK